MIAPIHLALFLIGLLGIHMFDFGLSRNNDNQVYIGTVIIFLAGIAIIIA
jgi:hypothetical protein